LHHQRQLPGQSFQRGHGSKFTAKIQETPLAAVRTSSRIVDLVQVLSKMRVRWVTASMTTLLLRLNDFVIDFHRGDQLLDAEIVKREAN
jgi:predicted deacylase